MEVINRMRRALRFLRRNKFLVAATALLMAGAGCLGAARETTQQLTNDALTPITVPVQAYKQAVDVASSTRALQQRQIDAAGGLE
jgi:hypothetical protein